MLVGVRRRRVGGEAADERKHLDHDGAVVVDEVGQGAGDGDGAAQFLVDLADEGGGGEFAGFDFAAGEFPLEREVFVRGALGDEDSAGGIFEDGTDNGNRFGGNHA